MLFKKVCIFSFATSLLCLSYLGYAEEGGSTKPTVDITGQLMIDHVYHLQREDNPELTNGAALRDAGLNFFVDFQNSIKFNLDLDIDNTGLHLGTAFLIFEDLFPHTDLLVGQVPTPFCLENSNSGKWLPFLERSLASSFKPCIGPGVNMTHHRETWALKIAARQPLFGHEIKADLGDGESKDTEYSEFYHDHWGGALRGTWVPVFEDGKVVHIGLSLSYQDMAGVKDDNPLKFLASEAKGRNSPKFGIVGLKAKDYMVAGLELSPLYGPFQLESEALVNQVRLREGDKKHLFYAGNVALNWVLTGQSRTYKVKDGAFGKIARTDVGSYGIWQLGLRYSHLDVSTSKEAKDKKLERNITAALNWYPTEEIKVAANYVYAMFEEGSEKTKLGTLALRLQTVF